MLNQIVLVGRLTKNPEIKEGENHFTMTLAIPRSFKNAEGEYEKDYVDCELYNNIATNTAEYCTENDIVGVKGRIQADHIGDTPKIIAEKVTFLSSNKKD